MNALTRIDTTQAGRLIREQMPEYGTQTVALADACGSILRETIHAERDQPPFDRVTMDGIAIRHVDLEKGMRFTVRGTQAAGMSALSLDSSGDCIEVMTGAVLPHGADTVVPVECIRREQDTVILDDDYRPTAGQFIHRQGSDHREGHGILQAGIRIGPPEMAVLTIGGKTGVQVARWPRIAIISTGDELVDVGEPVSPTQIRSSNDIAIASALQAHGCDRTRTVRVADDPDALRDTISDCLENEELLILSGGVSMGKYDYIPGIMKMLDVELVFHKILQRPGLPMWFGISRDGKPVFALPGNPVSTLVCMARYVLPAIESALGLLDTASRVRLAEPVHFEPDLSWLLPVILTHTSDGELVAIPKPTNTSGDFVSLAGTDGIVELPRGQSDFPQGHAAAFYRW